MRAFFRIWLAEAAKIFFPVLVITIGAALFLALASIFEWLFNSFTAAAVAAVVLFLLAIPTAIAIGRFHQQRKPRK